jgi:hypothetical protein
VHRKDHDGRRDLISPDLPGGFEATQHRHVQVENDNVRFQEECHSDSFAAVSRFAADLPTLLFEQIPQTLSQDVVIISDENA